MKAMRVVTIVCWIVTALVLLGLATWFLTGRVFGIGSQGLSFGGGIEVLTGSFEVSGSYTVDAGDVNSVNINWIAGDISVTPYDGSDILITEYARRELRGDECLTYGVSGGTLTIKFTERNNWQINMPVKKLDLQIPRDLCGRLDKFTVDSTSGGVNTEDINASAFKISTVSGSVDVRNTKSQTFRVGTTSGSIKIESVDTDDIQLDSVSGSIRLTAVNANSVKGDTTSGSVDISGAFKKVDLQSISGRLSVTSTIVPSNLKADTTSGSMTVTVPNTGEITVSHDSVSGKLSSDIAIKMQNRDAQFRFSTVSGSTKIQALGQYD